MDDIVDWARGMIIIGLAPLIVMLRVEAERFGTAEYYEATRYGERPKIRRRLAWYAIGVGLVIAILFIHPRPQVTLFLGSGDRLGAVLGGLAYGMAGVAFAVVFATVRYHRIRFPDSSSYPGALLNAIATSFIDEAGVPWRPLRPAALDRAGPIAGQPDPGRSCTPWRRASARRVATATCSSWPSSWAWSAAG